MPSGDYEENEENEESPLASRAAAPTPAPPDAPVVDEGAFRVTVRRVQLDAGVYEEGEL